MTNRRDFLKTVAAGAVVAAWPARSWTLPSHADAWFSPAVDPAEAWREVPRILARITPPVFPARDFAVTNFGARGDNRSDNTDAFRAAIGACTAAGGGRVVVPAGEFITGAIELKSNVNLHLDEKAVIRFTRDIGKYPIVFTRWEGVECMNFSPFIYAFEQENLGITGGGTIDGNCDCEHWWPWKGRTNCGWKEGDVNQEADRNHLFDMTERGVPVRDRVFGPGHFLRPMFIQPYRSKNILIEGVRLLNSPMWQVHPVLCTNVTVKDLNIKSDGPNTDGCDPESCTDVLIKNCDFDTGDDCIAINSGRNADGRRVNVPSQNIVIQGCHMKNGHGGITVGSEISGGVRNVFAEDCRLDSPELDYAVRVKNNALRGGLLEKIFVRNLEVGQVARAVVTVDFHYEEGDKGPFTPVLRDMVIENVRARKAQRAMDLQGFPNAPIRDISFVNCTFDGVEKESVVEYVEGMTMRNVTINGKAADVPR